MRALLSVHEPHSMLATAMGRDFKGKISIVIYLVAIPLAHVAIAVFVSASPADQETREQVIAKTARAVWDKSNK